MNITKIGGTEIFVRRYSTFNGGGQTLVSVVCQNFVQ